MATAGVVTTQRFSWMGYNGAETEEIDLQLLRTDPVNKDNYQSYAKRQQVIANIKERLYLIKRDLDLIPEEEMRAEEERRERRRAERQRAEEERHRAEEEQQQQQRVEEEARREEEERLRREAEAEEAARKAALPDVVIAPRPRDGGDSDTDSEAQFEADTETLESVTRTPQEVAAAVTTLSGAMRCLLLRQNAGYVSYVDASAHTSLAALERYNATHANNSNPATAAQDFSTEPLHAALDAYNRARQRLDQRRARSDATYSTRLRSRERAAVTAAEQSTATAPSHAAAEAGEEEDETALLTSVQVAHNSLTEARLAYNARAMKCGSIPPRPPLVPAAAPEQQAIDAPAVAEAAEAAAVQATQGAPVQASAPMDINSIETPATPATQEA